MKTLTPSDDQFNLELINEDEDQLYTILGISEERSDEIADIARKAYTDYQYFSESLKDAISQMNHINEVVFVTLCLGKAHAKTSRTSVDVKEQIELLKLLTQLKD